MDLVRYFEQQQVKSIKRPQLQAGDVVRVEMKITESGKERLQAFEGVVLGIRGSGPSATFTVRRETGRFAVERIFPLYSPLITAIDIVKRQKVRRAKLNYLRQAGRRRVKEDERAMQRHLQDLEEEKRNVEAAERRAEKAAAEKATAEKKAAEAKSESDDKDKTVAKQDTADEAPEVEAQAESVAETAQKESSDKPAEQAGPASS